MGKSALWRGEAGVILEYDRSGTASRLDVPIPRAFRQPHALPVDSHRWTSAALSTLRHSAPLCRHRALVGWRVENGEAFSTRYVQAASLTLRNRVRTKLGLHVRLVVRLAQLNPVLTQYRIGGHHVKIELRQRPVTGVLLRGQVENHPVCQLVGDWLVRRGYFCLSGDFGIVIATLLSTLPAVASLSL